MGLNGKGVDREEEGEVPGVYTSCCNCCSLLPSHCAAVIPYGSRTHSVVADSFHHGSLDFCWS